MEIISVRAQPGCADAAIAFLQQAWGGGNNEIMYRTAPGTAWTAPAPCPSGICCGTGRRLRAAPD